MKHVGQVMRMLLQRSRMPSLETLQEDGDKKAGQYFVAILHFKFIITLIVAEHILSSNVPPDQPLTKGGQRFVAGCHAQ